tara:strand:+ start:519 stop:620 length:102 start_codon:yes stop_codon:yes gene_type:complete
MILKDITKEKNIKKDSPIIPVDEKAYIIAFEAV